MLWAMRLPAGVFRLVKEAARHLLRRPVVGVAAAARTKDGRWLLIRRGDTGDWALPGGTLEWGETIHDALVRELAEETGARVESFGRLAGVYSKSDRDVRFHAVTIVVEVEVSPPERPPENPIEIREVALFADDALPPNIGMGMGDMIVNARRLGESRQAGSSAIFWE
jgi:8-oxo-dGTP diphosphatase